MAGLSDFRAQYPQYNDMSDSDLANSLYTKFYSDMPRDQFDAKLGIGQQQQQPQEPTRPPPSLVGSAVNYLSGLGGEVANAAKSGASMIGNALNPYSQQNVDAINQKVQQAKTAPFDMSGSVSSILNSVPANVAKGIGAIGAAPFAPVISQGGAAFDKITPTITPQMAAKFAQSGVTLPSGQDVISTAMLAARPGGANPVSIINKPASATAAQVKGAATSVYQDANVRGTNIPRQAVNQAIGQTMADFKQGGFRPTGSTNGYADPFDVLNEMKVAANPVRQPNGQFSKAQPVTAADLDNWSKTLGNTASETSINQQGLPQATPRAAAAMQLKSKIDDLLSTHAPGWADADANYAAAKTAEGLDRRSIIAGIKANGGNGDFATKLSNQATTLLLDPKVTSKFSPEDIAQLQTIQRGGKFSQKTLNWIASGLSGKAGHGAGALLGGLLAGGHFYAEGPEMAAMAAAAGGAAGATVDRIASGAAMALRNRIAAKNAGSLVNSVLAKSPYVQSLPPVPPSPPSLLAASVPGSQLPNAPYLLQRQLGLLAQ